MQRFFHDVVDQLQAMALRSPSPTQESSPTFPVPPSPGTPGNEARMSFTPVIRARDQFKPAASADHSQFADAEEEGGFAEPAPVTQQQAPQSGSQQAGSAYVPLQQQLARMIAPQSNGQRPVSTPAAIQPLAIRKPASVAGNAASPLQPRTTPAKQATGTAPARPPILRPTSTIANPVAPRVLVPRRGVSSMVQPSSPARMPGAFVVDENAPPHTAAAADKENYRKSAFAGSSPNPSSSDKKRVTLGLAIAGVPSPQQVAMPAFEPAYGAGAGNKLKRKSKATLTTTTNSPLFSSPNPTTEPAAAPKGSWFSNLFSWKTPSVRSHRSWHALLLTVALGEVLKALGAVFQNYVLLSTEDIYHTRLHCKRVLESIGATVVIENADGAGVLKCRVEEIRGTQLETRRSLLQFSSLAHLMPLDFAESNGSVSIVRPSKFRVEFSVQAAPTPSPSLSPSDHRGQFSTCITLIMEKGTQSTFKATYARLRQEWQ